METYFEFLIEFTRFWNGNIFFEGWQSVDMGYWNTTEKKVICTMAYE